MKPGLFLQFLLLDFRVYFRSPGGTFWTLVFPLLFFTLLIATNGTGSGRLGVVWLDVRDNDRTAESRAYASDLITLAGRLEALTIRPLTGSARPGDAVLALRIDPGFAAQLEAGGQSRAVIEVVRGDATPISAARSMLLALNDRLNIEAAPGTMRVEMALDQSATPPSLPYGTYIASGILSMMVFSTCLFGFTLPVVGMRQSGQLRMLRLMPVAPWLVVASFTMARVAIILLYAGVFAFYASQLAGVRFIEGPHDLAAALAIILSGTVAFLCLGAAIAAACPLREAATVVCNCLYFFFVFTSDAFVSNRGLPDAMLSVSERFPLHVMTAALREIARHDATSGFSIGTAVGTLLVWGGISGAAALVIGAPRLQALAARPLKLLRSA